MGDGDSSAANMMPMDSVPGDRRGRSGLGESQLVTEVSQIKRSELDLTELASPGYWRLKMAC